MKCFTALPQTKPVTQGRKDGYQHTHSSGWSHVIPFFIFCSPIPLQLKIHLTTIRLRRAGVSHIFNAAHIFTSRSYRPYSQMLISSLFYILYSQYGSASGAQARLSMMSCSSHPNETFLYYSETKILFLFSAHLNSCLWQTDLLSQSFTGEYIRIMGPLELYIKSGTGEKQNH